MGFLDFIASLIPKQNAEDQSVIRCASCGAAEIAREDMEHLRCRRCGRIYTLDEARKTMGTPFCRDCIYHGVNLYDPGIMENCFIWGLGKCREKCGRKETKPHVRWTDANRWE